MFEEHNARTPGGAGEGRREESREWEIPVGTESGMQTKTDKVKC